MKNRILSFIGLALLCVSVSPLSAQSTNSAPEVAPKSQLMDSAGEKALVAEGSQLARITNGIAWDVSPYLTYFPAGKANGVGTYGGGIYVQRELTNSQFFALGAGLDYMSGGTKYKAQLTMPSASANVKYPYDVGVKLGMNPGKFIAVPIALAGAAIPLSGAEKANLSIAGIAGTGVFFPTPWHPKFFGKDSSFDAGFMYTKWFNAGPFSGGHYQIFGNVRF